MHREMFARWDKALDTCLGTCPLVTETSVDIIASSLKHFDGKRYQLFDFVIMPNHVHLLASFDDEENMLAQIEAWKRFTARLLNRERGGRGRFWQPNGFDHLVRSE